MHCTVNQKENRKLRRRKVKKLSTVCWFAVHCPAPNLFLALEGSRMEDGGEPEKEVDLSSPGNRTTLLSTTHIFCTLSHFIDT